MWRPFDEKVPLLQERNVHVLSVAGRLAPGVELAHAQAEIDAIAERLAAAYPDSEGRDGVARETPLLALRASYETPPQRWDPLKWVMFGIIVAAVTGFAVITTASWNFGLWFTAGVALAFGLLVAVAKGLAALLKRTFPRYLPFPWRQGLANLHRPNNQTTATMLAVGLATFLLVTLYSVRHQLVQQVAEKGVLVTLDAAIEG